MRLSIICWKKPITNQYNNLKQKHNKVKSAVFIINKMAYYALPLSNSSWSTDIHVQPRLETSCLKINLRDKRNCINV